MVLRRNQIFSVDHTVPRKYGISGRRRQQKCRTIAFRKEKRPIGNPGTHPDGAGIHRFFLGQFQYLFTVYTIAVDVHRFPSVVCLRTIRRVAHDIPLGLRRKFQLVTGQQFNGLILLCLGVVHPGAVHANGQGMLRVHVFRFTEPMLLQQLPEALIVYKIKPEQHFCGPRTFLIKLLSILWRHILAVKQTG